MRTILYTVAVAAFATLAAAFPTGSPVCAANATTLLAVPNTPMGKEAPALGFALTYNFPNNQFAAGKQYKISLTGTKPFQGLLLWSLAADKTHPGQFNLPSASYKYVTAVACPGDPKGTVTHADPKDKAPVDFMWTAPTGGNTMQVQFVAAVVSGTPPQFQIIKDNKMFNAVTGTAPATNMNMTTPTPPSTATSGPGAGTDSGSGSGSGYGTMDMGSATSTGVSPAESTTANTSAAGSNAGNSTTTTPSSDAESLKASSSWILFGSTLLFLVALV